MNRNWPLAVFALALLAGLLAPLPAAASVDTAWVRRYDGPAHGSDFATAIATDTAGNVYVCGPSTGESTGGDFVTIKYYPSGDTAWVRRCEFVGNDRPNGICVDDSGNVYVAGTNNDSRMVTVKYSPAGVRLWYRLFGSGGGAFDLALDSQGNVIVCGASVRASLDAAVVKYRPNGDTAWARYFDWAGDEDHLQALAVAPNGDVAATGFAAGIGTHYDCITVKYDSAGSRLWAAGYDGPYHGDDRASDVAADSSGNVIVVGHTDNGYGTPPDYLTVKYSPTGETLWTRRYNGTADDWDEACAVAAERSGGIFVTGYSHDEYTKDDYTTIKYDSAGAVVWLRSYNGPLSDYDDTYALALDADGCAHVTGRSRGIGTLYDCATVKYGSDGETLWTVRYDGPSRGNDAGSCIAIGRRGDIVVAGQRDDAGGKDMLTIKYVQSADVVERTEPVMRLVSVPAVVRGAGWMGVGEPGIVMDAAGRRVAEVGPGRARPRLAPGIYFLREAQAQARAVRKIVVLN